MASSTGERSACLWLAGWLAGLHVRQPFLPPSLPPGAIWKGGSHVGLFTHSGVGYWGVAGFPPTVKGMRIFFSSLWAFPLFSRG